MKIKSVDDAIWAREQLEFKIEAFLREKGWKHTSSTPGCYWMWEREVDGRRVLVEKSMALNIQRHIDHLEEAPDVEEEGPVSE